MQEALPAIDFAIRQSPTDAILALANAAEKLGGFNVEVAHECFGGDKIHVANIKCLTPSPHRDLGIQFIAWGSEKSRISVEVRASRWGTEDPPSYQVYCEAAKSIANPILKQYNAATNSRCRLKIPSQAAMLPKLSPSNEKNFNRFVALANRTGLHPLDWRRFYQFVWHNRGRPIGEAEMEILLVKNGFPSEYAREISTVYVHLCEFKALR
jgi:hypothetical protein